MVRPMTDLALEKIETGEATSAEARLAVQALLKDGSADSLQRLYAALGAWLWKTLDRRRRDDELREWFDIFRRTSAILSENAPAYAERFRAFYDLLQTSISTSKVMSVPEVLQREHVKGILRLLHEAGGPTDKSVIAAFLNLKPANLTRVLNMMADARLVERTSYGKQARFGLTREGMEVASSVAPPAVKRPVVRRPAPYNPAVAEAFIRAPHLPAGKGQVVFVHALGNVGKQSVDNRAIALMNDPDTFISDGMWVAGYYGGQAATVMSSSLKKIDVDTTYRPNKTYESCMAATMSTAAARKAGLTMKTWEKQKAAPPEVPVTAAGPSPTNFQKTFAKISANLKA